MSKKLLKKITPIIPRKEIRAPRNAKQITARAVERAQKRKHNASFKVN